MKKITKTNEVSQEEIDKLSELSDDKNTRSAPTFKLPSLRLNGKEGSYYKTSLTKSGEIVTGDDGKALLEKVEKPEGVILRARKSFNFVGGDFQLFTNEGGISQKTIFTVFEKRETAKGFSIKMAGQGTPAEIKTQFPELKMTQILYFLLNGEELVRLKVKGMSLGNLFDYFKQFSANEHAFQFLTILGEEKDKNQFGKFVKATFTKGDRLTDLSAVKENMELISKKVAEIEEYAKERSVELTDELSPSAEGSRLEARPLDEIRESLKLVNEETVEELEENDSTETKAEAKRKKVQLEQDEINVKDIKF